VNEWPGDNVSAWCSRVYATLLVEIVNDVRHWLERYVDDADPIEHIAAERGISGDEAAMKVVLADQELLDEIAKSTECVRAGKRLLTHDEVFGAGDAGVETE